METCINCHKNPAETRENGNPLPLCIACQLELRTKTDDLIVSDDLKLILRPAHSVYLTSDYNEKEIAILLEEISPLIAALKEVARLYQFPVLDEAQPRDRIDAPGYDEPEITPPAPSKPTRPTKKKD